MTETTTTHQLNDADLQQFRRLNERAAARRERGVEGTYQP